MTELPAGRLRVSARLPDPAAVLPVAPPAATLVKVQVRIAGKVSARVTAGSALGPALEATLV